MVLLLLVVSCREWSNPVDDKETPQRKPPTRGLVAWYPFDGNANDESGMGYNGTVNGAVLTADRFGESNNAYLFDGIDDYVDTNHDFSWTVEDSFSLSLWFVTRNNNQIQVLIGKDGTQYWEYSLFIDAQKIGFIYWRPDAEGNLAITSKTAIPNDDAWRHVCITYNGATRTGWMYIDGLPDAWKANVGAAFIDRNNTTQIGFGYYWRNTAYGFNGRIDDVRIYSRALTESEVLALYYEGGYGPLLKIPDLSVASVSNSSIQLKWTAIERASLYQIEQSAAQTGPFTTIYSGSDTVYTHRNLNKAQRVWYRMRAQNAARTSAWSDTVKVETSSVPLEGLVASYPFNGNANDESGNNNHGTVNGATLVPDRFGYAQNAYRFDGNDYIQIPDNAVFDDIERKDFLSVSMWINIYGWWCDSRCYFTTIDKYRYAGDFGWVLYIVNNKFVFHINGGRETAYTFQTNIWYHIAITYERSTSKYLLYVNNKLIESYAVNGDIPDTDGSCYIGYSPSGGDDTSNGIIDDIYIYDRVLTAAEVSALYHSGGWEN